jgi:rod shape-determining protein MreC
MFTFLSENRVAVLAGLLLAGCFLLMSAHIRVASAGTAVESAVLGTVSPVVRGGAGVVGGARGWVERYVDLRGLQVEAERLRAENETLRLERQRLEEAAAAGVRLRQLLGLRQAVTLPTVAARVIAIDLIGPFRIAILDRGTADGVARDDAVMTAEGLIGRVTAVSKRLAKVQLIIDPTSAAAALVERTRVQGVAAGRDVNRLELVYLSTLQDVAVGDMIDSAGLDGVYPRGLRLGQVAAVEPGVGLQRRVLVDTAVDFRALEEVLVVRVDRTVAEEMVTLRSAPVERP